MKPKTLLLIFWQLQVAAFAMVAAGLTTPPAFWYWVAMAFEIASMNLLYYILHNIIEKPKEKEEVTI